MSKRSYKRNNKFTARQAKGTALIELVVIAFVFPLVALICVNIGILAFAAWTNDNACKDAARIAAQQTNAKDAFAAAAISLQNYSNNAGGVAGAPKLVGAKPAADQVTTGLFQYNIYPDPATGAPQVNKGPYVKVTTELKTTLPAPIAFNGATFTNQVKFSTSYIYPIIAPEPQDNNEPEIETFDPDDSQALADADNEDAEAGAQEVDENLIPG